MQLPAANANKLWFVCVGDKQVIATPFTHMVSLLLTLNLDWALVSCTAVITRTPYSFWGITNTKST